MFLMSCYMCWADDMLGQSCGCCHGDHEVLSSLFPFIGHMSGTLIILINGNGSYFSKEEENMMKVIWVSLSCRRLRNKARQCLQFLWQNMFLCGINVSVKHIANS